MAISWSGLWRLDIDIMHRWAPSLNLVVGFRIWVSFEFAFAFEFYFFLIKIKRIFSVLQP